MKVYAPMINCGLNAGQAPMCWDGVYFSRKEECEWWISDNMDNFSPNEIGGGVFPIELEVGND